MTDDKEKEKKLPSTGATIREVYKADKEKKDDSEEE